MTAFTEMARSSVAGGRPGHVPGWRLPAALILVALLTCGVGLADPAPASAASGPKVAIIVGPAGSATATNRTWANAAAREARRYTANVVKVYSPYATWARVKAAISGASIVVYYGRGLGFPSPNSSSLLTSSQNGFLLNPVSGANNTTARAYGEWYIQTTRLAPKALVILDHLTYASGNSAPGRSEPTLSVARRRVDNYAAGFLAAGASAVIAESNRSVPAYYIRAVFKRTASLSAIWRAAPTYHGHATTFASSRTTGASGRTDPNRSRSGFNRSIAGWLRTSTAYVRRPAPASTALKTVTVASIPDLKTALADDSVDEIVVADGTYHVSPSNDEAADSLWIGGQFAARTRPIVVRAATPGRVILDGAGASGYSALSFEDGAHDQTWDGFTFANMGAHDSGIVEVGGYLPRRTPHHLTLRNFTILASCTGRATTSGGSTWDHGVYIAHAAGVGPHDILIEDLTVDGGGFLASAVHFDHGDADNPAATDVTVRRLHVVGTQQAIILWKPALHDITFDAVDIRGALAYAVRYESIGGSGILFANITSSGSGIAGFSSAQGSTPPGVTLANDSLH
jgi:hypothetical protein